MAAAGLGNHQKQAEELKAATVVGTQRPLEYKHCEQVPPVRKDSGRQPVTAAQAGWRGHTDCLLVEAGEDSSVYRTKLTAH